MYQLILVGIGRYKPVQAGTDGTGRYGRYGPIRTVRTVQTDTKSGTKQKRTNSVKPPKRNVPTDIGTKLITLI